MQRLFRTPNMADKIDRAYARVGQLSMLYDGMMKNQGVLGRLAMKYFWRLSDEKYDEFLAQAFRGIPKDFAGRLLEIPAGTGVLSFPIYERLNSAKITCADISQSMLDAARRNLEKLRLDNVELVQCDVGAMPFADESFDVLLSLNGFHAFSDKKAAFEETRRVLKADGIFCGCMYVKGLNDRTDWFVENFCQRYGFFTPPFETLTTLSERLKQLYDCVELTHVEAFAGFVCRGRL